ncbi:glycosyl transferase family 17 [Pelagibacterales bacterium SAG-MED39]|nr:glycosyl transferase family 17 [Pelagibacterales bacterium SAG-MED39]
MKNRIIDTITFFQENRHFDLRFNILKDVVDKFLICESIYDHRGNKKKVNFNMEKYKYNEKIKHVVVKEKFPKKNDPWKNQAIQRENILKNLDDIENDDFVMFSDPDEIPNPKILKNFELKKKYGIFSQKIFSYKLNLLNPYESPWEGTRICKKKHLKSVDWLRHKVLGKNLKYPFWRIDKEKNIQIINNGGWHFSYLLKPEEIEKKFKSLAETSWDNEKFSNLDVIKKKINDKVDLFDRGHEYNKVNIDDSYPDYILRNMDKLKEWII